MSSFGDLFQVYYLAHSELRRKHTAKSKRLSVTLFVETPLCPYGMAYRRAHGSSTPGLFKKSLCCPLCGGKNPEGFLVHSGFSVVGWSRFPSFVPFLVCHHLVTIWDFLVCYHLGSQQQHMRGVAGAPRSGWLTIIKMTCWA